MTQSETPETAWDKALDAALARALAPAAVPARFRARLEAALARESAANLAGVRARFEREHRERLAELEAGYLRLRRRSLGALIGGAFAAGIAVPIALPWFNEHFGRYAPTALAAVGATIGLCVGVASWFKAQQASPG